MVSSCSDFEALLQSNDKTCKLINKQGNVLASHSEIRLGRCHGNGGMDNHHLWLFETSSSKKTKYNIMCLAFILRFNIHHFFPRGILKKG